MTKLNNTRRSFLKVSAAAGGGIILGFNLSSCKSDPKMQEIVRKAIPSEWFDINTYLKIGDTGLVTIFSANPEIGQNIKTSMPMIVAEELEVDWNDVVVDQVGLNTEWYKRQVAGGSQSIRQGWTDLRTAGATAKQMLVEAAAKQWEIEPSDCTVENGIITNATGETLSYGDVASAAAQLEVPEDVNLKDPKDFKIIGQSKVNVDMEDILTGKALFGIDYIEENMVYASVLRPPSFGKELVNYDDTETRKVTGVSDVIKFGNKVAVLASNTWAAMKGQKALKAEWKDAEKIEDTTYHNETIKSHLAKKTVEPRRVDGDVDKAFADADEVFERIYEAPFLPHSCLEPMNFFAHVTDKEVLLTGPIQTPAWTQSNISELLGRDKSEIKVNMTRMGGGFGRRLYGDFALEAAEISSLSKKPIKLTFSREDDMTAGTYRPGSAYKFKAGIKDGQMTGYHLTEAFFNGSMFGQMPSNFPAGAVDNYRVDCHKIKSNITTGAWRAPYANFLASAEQSFFDELAMHLGQDPVQFRLDLFQKAKDNPVGDEHNYDTDKFVSVIKLATEKSNWGSGKAGVHKGFSAYYSHNTYVAEVADVIMEKGVPIVKKITCAVDCGIVINPKAALNQIEGGIIDGIGHAMYGDFEFVDGRTQSTNFHNYRLIRMPEAPEIEVHFIESTNDPTGLGEPTLPPAGGAIANAFAAATGKRFYRQPFIKYEEVAG